MIQVENAVMVVAHPDDEIIWFSSILAQCKSVIVCFGQSADSKRSWDSGRASLMESYPLSKVKFLKVRQSDAHESADWRNPKETPSGLKIRKRSSSLYERNALQLSRILEQELIHESVVFTHNPWGEYGNEEHVQVFRVLVELKTKLGFDLLVSSYVSDRSTKLMSKHLRTFDDTPMSCETNRPLAAKLKKLYISHNCWTFMEDYQWPAVEQFYRVVENYEGPELRTSASLPLNFISYEFNQSLVRKFIRRSVPGSIKKKVRCAFRLLLMPEAKSRE